jgi:hypothetical protein
MRQERYQKALVTFLDVLGFKALVAEREPKELAIALAEFERHSAPFFRANGEHLTHIAFSDTIIRVSPFDDPRCQDEILDRLTTEASDVAAAQTLLCQKHIVVRGAIVCGDIWLDGSRIFGPALIRAYELERDQAIHPRVIIDPMLVEALEISGIIDDEVPDYEDLGIDHIDLRQYLSRDRDGEVFVDYLYAMISLGQDGTAESAEETAILLRKHKSLIDSGLATTDLSVRRKYEWMARYHNARTPTAFDMLRV